MTEDHRPRLPGCMMLLFVALTACDAQSDFDQCVDQKQKQYKAKNPDASYATLVNRRETFERECIHLKR